LVSCGIERIWVADDEPSTRFPLYSRGNVGEVFPHVMTALTGTLIGDAVARGQLDSIREMGVLLRSEMEGPAVGTGVFGGYLYQNASTMRLFGVRAPAMSVADVDQQVLGDVPGLPTYVRRRGDRSLWASMRVVLHMLQLIRTPDLSELDHARADACAWLATMPELRDAADAELLAWLRSYPSRQGESMRRLLSSSIAAGVPLGLLQRLLERANQPALLNRIIGGTGDIDSARLAQRLWLLGRLVADDRDLAAAFDQGLDGVAERTEGTVLSRELAAFLADHGHRCNDEYELAAPAWAMDPAPVYAAVDRLRRAPVERDPAMAAQRLAADADAALAEAAAATPRLARGMLRRFARQARIGAIARERAKDILVLENLGARRLLHELVHRAAQRGGPDEPRHAFCVTASELVEFVENPTEFASVIAERAARQDYLNARVPPDWFEGCIPDPATWKVRSEQVAPVRAPGSVVQGIAVSGGAASGPARVVRDPSDPRGLESGEVLVCAITDPSWTPLFLGAVAVVCDTGAMLSHAAIVARELGIPAVLSVPGITGIADGTMLYVDGVTGEVRVGEDRTGEDRTGADQGAG
jgi:rifampicin phosphotransferase